MLSWQLVKEILKEHDQNIKKGTNSEVDDGDIEVEVAEGDPPDYEDVEVEVNENVEAEVQEDVELEIDQVEVGTVLLKRTLLT